MPNGSIIAFRLIFLRVGVHPLQSKAAYVKDHKTIVFLRLPKNFTGTFGGIKLVYRKIPKGKNSILHAYACSVKTVREL